MNALRLRSLFFVMAAVLVVACHRFAAPDAVHVGTGRETPPGVVTADIQRGIEQQIEERVQGGGGFFRLPHEGRELRLKLVRVHTEYLANLGPEKHFACVDLVDTSGDVYDVDFFLEGDPGQMKVTETTVHKLNGKPYYAWERTAEGTWQRIAVDTAPEKNLGVVRGVDTFEFRYFVRLPSLAAPARMWLPLPQNDAFQTVAMKSIDAPGARRTLKDSAHGNDVLFLELQPSDGNRTVEMRFVVERKEKSAYEAPDPKGQYLAPDRLVPITDEFRATVERVLADKQGGDLVRARALYDHVIDEMRYMKYGEGFGQGDAVRACGAGSGNCTDYHSYFMGLARAAGIPVRFAIGASIPSERDNGGIDGYHCWVEFWAEGKWWPVDISEADKYTRLSTYYFGHHPANRMELSRGRDLVVDPLPASGPINFLAYPILEVNGAPAKPAELVFWFERTTRL